MRSLRQFLRRPTIRMGSVDNSRISTTRIRNAQFVSFFSENGCVSGVRPDYHDTRLRRRKALRVTALLVVAALGTWVVIESAKALTML